MALNVTFLFFFLLSSSPSALQTAQDVSFNNVLALFVDLSARCIQPNAEEPLAEMDRRSVTLKGRYLFNKKEFCGLVVHRSSRFNLEIRLKF